MSDNSHADDTVHTGPIKNPKQLLITVFFAFVVPIFIIIGIVYYVTSANMPAAGTVNAEKSANERIQKVGTVVIGDQAQIAASLATPVNAVPATPVAVAAAGSGAGAAPAANIGETRYKETCFACHATGVAGAPKFGDKAAWAPRIATGMDALVAAAIHGLNAMPPRGGSNASDDEIKATVAYMVNAAK